MSTQDNLVDANELEAALAHMKQMQNDQLTAPPRWGFWTRICHTKKTIYTATEVPFSESEFVTKRTNLGGKSLRTSLLSWTQRIEM